MGFSVTYQFISYTLACDINLRQAKTSQNVSKFNLGVLNSQGILCYNNHLVGARTVSEEQVAASPLGPPIYTE